MAEPAEPNDKQSESSEQHERPPGRSSRMLVFIMLGVIILSIAAFLILHPDPSGSGHTTTTSSHSAK